MSTYVHDNRSTEAELRAFLRRARWTNTEDEDLWCAYVAGMICVLRGLISRNVHLPFGGWEHIFRKMYEHNGEIFIDRIIVRVKDWRTDDEIEEAAKKWGFGGPNPSWTP